MLNYYNEIHKVGVVDDNEDGRNTFGLIVEDAHLIPILQDESVLDLQAYLDLLQSNVDALISDHHLRKVSSYFPVDGAELVANCYDRKLPSLLVTKYEQAEILEIRKHRQRIPVVLTPDEYSVDSMMEGFEKCIKEFKGYLSSDRKPWRTLVRIDDVKGQIAYLIIPAWDSNQPIPLNLSSMPLKLCGMLKADFRVFAQVNIGCENINDLYFFDWEF